MITTILIGVGGVVVGFIMGIKLKPTMGKVGTVVIDKLISWLTKLKGV
jgi:hypothetical protein